MDSLSATCARAGLLFATLLGWILILKAPLPAVNSDSLRCHAVAVYVTKVSAPELIK